jgi:hypothetical protein
VIEVTGSMQTPSAAVSSGWWQLGLRPVRTADGVALDPGGFVWRRWLYLFGAVVVGLVAAVAGSLFVLDAVKGVTAGYENGSTPLGQAIGVMLGTVPFVIWWGVKIARTGRGLDELAGAEPIRVRLAGRKAGRKSGALIFSEVGDERSEPGLSAFEFLGGFWVYDLMRRPEQELVLYLTDADRHRRPGLTAPGLVNLGGHIVPREELRLDEPRARVRSGWFPQRLTVAPTRLPAAIQVGRQTLWVISDRAGG